MFSKPVDAHTTSIATRPNCGPDTISWMMGVALVITGVVLFILNALYSVDLYIAAVIVTSIGSIIFFLGLCANCCIRSVKAVTAIVQEQGTAVGHKQGIKAKSVVPLDKATTTRAFFEGKGLFGLPRELIDTIDIWRTYRTSENFDIALDAGFILDGPPGNGKTTVAKAIAEILGGEYVERKCGELKNFLHGETERNITKLFTVPDNQFKVIVLDEISGLLPKRGHFMRTTDEITEHFLATVEGIEQKAPRYIVIGTTNNYTNLDPALVRRGRLGKRFILTNPNYQTRVKILNYQLAKIKHSDNENWSAFIENLAKELKSCSCADIKGRIGDAQEKACRASRPLRIEDFKSNSNSEDFEDTTDDLD